MLNRFKRQKKAHQVLLALSNPRSKAGLAEIELVVLRSSLA